MLSYCLRICLDITSAQKQLDSDIWAICMENVRCPTVISSSEWDLTGALMQNAYRIVGNFRGVLIFIIFVTDLTVTIFAPYENLRQ